MAEPIVALDVPSRERAFDLVGRLGPDAGFVKVGLELYTRAGPGIVRELRDRGKRVFLDLKLMDIPNTVAGAVSAAAAAGADLLTVHATGGMGMLEAAAGAARACRAEGRPLRLLAVTVLTSLTVSDVESVWGRDSIPSLRDEVVRLGRLAASAGVDGAVASALEAEALRRALGPDFLLVTPGIRLEGDGRHDQARTATPREAAAAGADYLVVGRAVTAADDPAAALARVRGDVARAGVA